MLVSPLQIGLAVQMHYNSGSRFLINSLHEHGFCSSYSEVQCFEHSAALTRGRGVTHGGDVSPPKFELGGTRYTLFPPKIIDIMVKYHAPMKTEQGN